MEARALCIRLYELLMTAMILLCAHDQKVDAVFLHIIPNRSQFFEYESVTFYCQGVSYCEVVHKFNGKMGTCSETNKRTATGSSCSLKNIYTEDSGEYWYETAGGERSNILNINVTAGSVILESPALPVMEGEDVTLLCKNKRTSSNFTAAFYKDGRRIRSSFTGKMTIHRVSKVDEGLYKCSISGAGESPGSWLNVTVDHTETPTEPSSDTSCHVDFILRTVFIIVMVAVLLLVVGLFHCVKVGAMTTNSYSLRYKYICHQSDNSAVSDEK